MFFLLSYVTVRIGLYLIRTVKLNSVLTTAYSLYGSYFFPFFFSLKKVKNLVSTVFSKKEAFIFSNYSSNLWLFQSILDFTVSLLKFKPFKKPNLYLDSQPFDTTTLTFKNSSQKYTVEISHKKNTRSFFFLLLKDI